MALLIRTTGLEQYAPGGEARLKLLIIGGPGTGKTRFASYFPRPIYADCEAGLASVADRTVPYVTVNSSSDMLDLLTHLKQECRQPKDRRTYDTVIIDTFDAYQRKLKNEWMEKERKEAFTGWEAWGFVGQKMSLLLTKLLNLDMNVIVNVHFKDKTTKDDDTGVTTHELMLQLQGEVADTAFNDFDLVGWMGTYWEAVGGERVQKRGLTFKPTPDKPFLKDRLHVTPTWMEITFDDSDYENLLSRVSQRLGDLMPGETVGEIPTAENEIAPGVVTPEAATSGPLPEQKAAELPLAQLDRPGMLRKVRELGITTLADGTAIRGNTVKSELLAAIEHHLARGTTATPAPAPEPVPESAPEPEIAKPAAAKPPVVVPRQSHAPTVEQVSEGLVDTSTGELVSDRAAVLDAPPASSPEPSVEDAIATVADQLGGAVVSQTADKTPAATEALARRTDPAVSDHRACQECGIDLATEDQNYVKLAWIKYRAKLCQADYQKRKAG